MLVPCPQVFSSLWSLLLHLCISLLKWSLTRAVLTPQYTLSSSRTFSPAHISQQVVLQPPGAAVLPTVSPDLPVDVARLSNGSYGSLCLSPSLSFSPNTHLQGSPKDGYEFSEPTQSTPRRGKRTNFSSVSAICKTPLTGHVVPHVVYNCDGFFWPVFPFKLFGFGPLGTGSLVAPPLARQRPSSGVEITTCESHCISWLRFLLFPGLCQGRDLVPCPRFLHLRSRPS